MKPPVHRIPEQLLSREVKIILVGAGGNGSQMLTGLARLDRGLRALGHPRGLDVIVFDPDKVSEANVGRQLFSAADIGHYKACVLVHRINQYFGLNWEAQPLEYPIMDAMWIHQHLDIVISCVDSAKARRMIYRDLCNRTNRANYWLDMGNRQHDGQVVLGEIPWTMDIKALHGRTSNDPDRLPNIFDLFPEMANPKFKEDNRPSCSLAEALEQQDLFVNQGVSTFALNLLWRLFRDGQLSHHGYFINLKEGRVNPIPVPGCADTTEAKVEIKPGNNRNGAHARGD